MTQIDTTRFASPRVPGLRPSGLLGRLLAWFDAWEDRRHLHALSDHMLKDMGFTRDQIDDVLQGALRRQRS